MNIQIRFRGLGIEDTFQAKVLVIDMEGNTLYDGYSYDGTISVCLETEHIYKIIAYSCFEVIYQVFYVDQCHSLYTFYFPRSIVKSSVVTFLLTDSNYLNLPIMKGEMYLD